MPELNGKKNFQITVLFFRNGVSEFCKNVFDSCCIGKCFGKCFLWRIQISVNLCLSKCWYPTDHFINTTIKNRVIKINLASLLTQSITDAVSTVFPQRILIVLTQAVANVSETTFKNGFVSWPCVATCIYNGNANAKRKLRSARPMRVKPV